MAIGSRERINKAWDAIHEAKPNRAPRVCVIADREWWNIQEVIDLMNRSPKKLQLGGIIVPGGEFDGEILHLARRVNAMESGMAIPVEEAGRTRGWKFVGPGVEFDFAHAPYDSAQMRGDDGYRAAYCARLAAEVERTGADIIFLSNFKIVLNREFVSTFEGRVVNVHPSVLPLLKGMRPEARAHKGEDPDAAGYTMHLVNSDLDGGATVFQQRVRPVPYDAKEEERLGNAEYAKRREEQLRLKIIDAQSRYSAEVLALIASGRERKIVEGAEAFAAEGRPGFEKSPAYRNMLGQEQNPKPYQRLLFKSGKRWKTAEQLLRAPRYSKETKLDVATTYTFAFEPGNQERIIAAYRTLVSIAEKVRGERGPKTDFQTSMVPGTGIITIRMPFVAPDLVAQAQFAGIECSIESYPTRVTAPRKPIRTDSD